MKNGLLLALSGKFPMWEECLEHNLQFDVENVIIRLDKTFNPTQEFGDKLSRILKGKQAGVYKSDKKMNNWNWREELLNNYHLNRLYDTDYILFPDEDEKFPDDLTLESDGQLMFDYTMVTGDFRDVFKYPADLHNKAFKYHINLSYNPYFHYARVSKDGKPLTEYRHRGGNMLHYCFYKQEWEESKIKSINDRYPDYFAKFGTNK